MHTYSSRREAAAEDAATEDTAANDESNRRRRRHALHLRLGIADVAHRSGALSHEVRLEDPSAVLDPSASEAAVTSWVEPPVAARIGPPDLNSGKKARRRSAMRGGAGGGVRRVRMREEAG